MPGRAALFGLALALRLVSAWVTVAPDRDTSNYIEMARAFRALDWASALAHVFPPLYPLLLAPFGPGSGDPETWWLAGQLFTAIVGSMAVVVVFIAVREMLDERAGAIAATWLAAGMVPAWTVADALSEPLFQLLLATWLLAWVRRSTAGIVVTAALLFIVRPEGGAILVPTIWRLVAESPRITPLAVVAMVLPRLSYLGLRASATGSFLWFPKREVMHDLSMFDEPDVSQAVAHWATEAVRFLGQGFDGVGYLAFPCLVLALVSIARGREARVRAHLVAIVAVLAALLVVPCFFGNRRFWTPWLPVLLPLAALPVARLYRDRPRLVVALIVLGLLPHTARLFFPRRARLAPDVAVGRMLRAELAPEAAVASDLPRLLLFSGRPALPPRSIEGAELMASAARSRTAAVVSLTRRGKLDRARLLALGYTRVELDAAAERRGLELWRR